MDDSGGFRKVLIGVLFTLLAIIAFGLFWFFTGTDAGNPEGVWWFVFSFAAGLTMIVLPCTLPLAFVIVPLSMGKGPVKGLFIALAFGIGVALTLSMYGVLAALIGHLFIGILGTSGEVLKNWLYFVAGIFAYVFALGQVGLVNFKMPSYTGAFPGFIQKQGDVLKAFLLGLFLGNIGVGCPHPATPMIFIQIVSQGNIFYGWLLFLAHAIGRIVPLLFLAILGILGVNALGGLVKSKDKIERSTGWAMIFVAAFILVLGFFTHDWWVVSGQHTLLESFTQEESILNFLGAKFGTGNAHHHGLPAPDRTALLGFPISWGTGVLLLLWIFPFFWDYAKKKKAFKTGPEAERTESNKKILSEILWNRVLIAALIIVVFGYAVPTYFLQQNMNMTMSMSTGGMSMGSGGMNMSGSSAMSSTMNMAGAMSDADLINMNMVMHGPSRYYEASNVTTGPVSNLVATPASPRVGEPVRLDFSVNDKSDGKGIPESSLEVMHSKKMHVIGVRKDLQDFFHIHPSTVADRPGSTLSVNYAFTEPGDYKIWSEVKYKGVNYTFGEPMIHVTDQSMAASYNLDKDFSLSKVVGSYQVRIAYGQLGVGYNHIDFYVRDAKGTYVALENYLEAQMHLSVISDNLVEFIHTHPLASEEPTDDHTLASTISRSFDVGSLLISKALAHGGDSSMTSGSQSDHVTFQVPFTKPGNYKVFAQFRPAGVNLPADEALTASFWVSVSPTPPVPPAAPYSPLEKVRIVIVSLILMTILILVVRKYITVL